MIVDPSWRKQIILESFIPAIDEYEYPLKNIRSTKSDDV